MYISIYIVREFTKIVSLLNRDISRIKMEDQRIADYYYNSDQNCVISHLNFAIINSLFK